MLKRIREKLLSIARKVLRGTVRLVRGAALAALALVLLVNILLPIEKAAKDALDSQGTYVLVVLGSYGPMLVPVDQVIVQNVERKQDGSLCFNQPGETKRGCVKAAQYYLKPMNVK